MSKTTKTAEQAARAARVALLVPPHARENYVAMVRHHAEQHGVTEAEQKAAQIDLWRAQHEYNPTDGYDVLADWLEDADLDSVEYTPTAVDPDAAERVRAVESAKREYDQPLDGFTEGEAAQIEAHRAHVRASVTEPATEAATEPDEADASADEPQE